MVTKNNSFISIMLYVNNAFLKKIAFDLPQKIFLPDKAGSRTSLLVLPIRDGESYGIFLTGTWRPSFFCRKGDAFGAADGGITGGLAATVLVVAVAILIKVNQPFKILPQPNRHFCDFFINLFLFYETKHATKTILS